MEASPSTARLNELSEKIRTPETRALLDRVDQSLSQLDEQLDIHTAEFATGFREVLNMLQRGRKQFSANLFFVVIFGALKSGKSTLTNALAESLISPTGFGRDTTLRPCLIVRGERTRCCQYFLRKSMQGTQGSTAEEASKNLVKERSLAFGMVTDYLKGTVTEDELNQVVETVEFPFTPEELEKRLTTKISASEPEPLVTVVWIPTGSFLDNGICLIDMPGLDSVEHNSEIDHIHNWVIDDADFFLFLQSSVAALNQPTEQFLRSIQDQKKRRPMWALQNVIDARWWIDIEERRKEWDEQREHALKKLKQVLRLANEEKIYATWFNLGQEWDGIQVNRTDWREWSQFREFKVKVTLQLQTERAHIKEINCLQKLDGAVLSSLNWLKQIENYLETKLGQLAQKKHVLSTQLPAEVQKLSYFTSERLRDIRSILSDRLIDPQVNDLRKQIVAKVTERAANARQFKKGELEAALERMMKDLREIAESAFKYDGKVREVFDSIIKREIDEGANVQVALRNIDDLWTAHHPATAPLSDALKRLPVPEPPKFKCEIEIPLDLASKYPPIFVMFEGLSESVYNADEVADKMRDHGHRFVEKLGALITSWKETILEPLRDYDVRRRDALKTKLEAETVEFDTANQPSIDAANAATNNIRIARAALNEWGYLLQNAQKSLWSNGSA